MPNTKALGHLHSDKPIISTLLYKYYVSKSLRQTVLKVVRSI